MFQEQLEHGIMFIIDPGLNVIWKITIMKQFVIFVLKETMFLKIVGTVLPFSVTGVVVGATRPSIM